MPNRAPPLRQHPHDITRARRGVEQAQRPPRRAVRRVLQAVVGGGEHGTIAADLDGLAGAGPHLEAEQTLDPGEQAIVLGPGAGWSPLDRPRILIFADEDGFHLDQPITADLGQRHARRQSWLRTIARTRDPRKLGIKVPALVFGPRIEAEIENLDRQVMLKPRPRTRAGEDEELEL